MGIDALDGARPCYFADYGTELVAPELIPSELDHSKPFDFAGLAFPATPTRATHAKADLAPCNNLPTSAAAYRPTKLVPQRSTHTDRRTRHHPRSPTTSPSHSKLASPSSPSRSIGTTFDAFPGEKEEMEFLDDILMELCPMSTNTIMRLSSRARSINATSNSTPDDQSASIHRPSTRYARPSSCGSVEHDTEPEESDLVRAADIVPTPTLAPAVTPEPEQGPNMPARNKGQKHACTICGQLYRRPYLLRDHMASHRQNREKSHPCEYADCRLSFTTRSNLRRHCNQKHRGAGHVQPTAGPMESASEIDHSMESPAFDTEDSVSTVDARDAEDSAMSVDGDDDEPAREATPFQPVAYGPRAPSTTADSDSRLPAPSEAEKMVRALEVVPRAIIPGKNHAYTRDFDLRTISGKNDLEMIEVHEMALITPVSRITFHSAADSDPAGLMDISKIFSRQASSEFINFARKMTRGMSFNPVVYPNPIIRHPFSKLVDRLIRTTLITRGRSTKVRGPVKRPRPFPPRLLTNSPSCLSLFPKRQHLQRSPAASALGLLYLYILSRDPGASGFQGFNYASGSSQTPSGTRPTQGSGGGIWSGQGPGLESFCVPGEEINVNIQPTPEALKQYLGVLFSDSLNAHTSGPTLGQPEFAPSPPPPLPLDLDKLLQQTYSDGFLAGIKYALSDLCGLAGPPSSSIHSEAGATYGHVAENVNPQASSVPQPSWARFRRIKPASSTVSPATLAPPGPSEAGPSVYAPIIPSAPHSAPPHLPPSTDLEPLYHSTLSEIQNSTTNFEADRSGQDYDIPDFGLDHDAQPSQNYDHTPYGTRPISSGDMPSASTSQIPAVQPDPLLSATCLPQPITMPSPGPRGKDDQRHKCSMCDRSFRKPYLLEDHMQSKHLRGEKVHACGFGGCDRTFSTRSNLRKHIRTKHTVEEGMSGVFW